MKKNLITIAIDSPAAAGAGTQSKLLSKEYNLLYLDTVKIYRYIGKLNLDNKNRFNYALIKKKMKKVKIKHLKGRSLLSDEIAKAASEIAKDKVIRDIVRNFQHHYAYNPPKRFKGSVLDGRDITSVIMKDAMFKFFITASLKVRAKRRYLEFKKLKKNIPYSHVLKSLRNRDNLDKLRKISPLKKTKDSILINTTKLSKNSCFKKIKRIIDKKLKINGNI